MKALARLSSEPVQSSKMTQPFRSYVQSKFQTRRIQNFGHVLFGFSSGVCSATTDMRWIGLVKLHLMERFPFKEPLSFKKNTGLKSSTSVTCKGINCSSII